MFPIFNFDGFVKQSEWVYLGNKKLKATNQIHYKSVIFGQFQGKCMWPILLTLKVRRKVGRYEHKLQL